MDVIWLKKDIRLHDHGPLRTALTSNNPVLLLYLYEPDQLSHPTIHGSHILFQNEGLEDFTTRLRTFTSLSSNTFPITIIKDEATSALSYIHSHYPIGRILAHMETGHLCSFQRDIRVRNWCKQNNIPIREYKQTGVVRGLRDRDQFTKRYNTFINTSQHQLPAKNHPGIRTFASRLITLSSHISSSTIPTDSSIQIYNRVLSLSDLQDYLNPIHANDRPSRQRGGETTALETFNVFLSTRGEGYARGVSSPNTAWDSCSRLSPYLAAGHISVRYIAQTLKLKQEQLRKNQKNIKGDWLRSLAAFHSRIRWRSHFIQKLESEPELEKHAACRMLDTVRTTPGEWNEERYQAWASGKTGSPMVDACMRCLLRHGWVNFRMRAMLVSFACYNLWLDWRGIAPHLARCFLDYEPGIHYPQLQMQAGVTGINTMRVYSVTKQAVDQDPNGRFIRKYVPELRDIPDEFIHEPWKMLTKRQTEIYFEKNGSNDTKLASMTRMQYPKRIVDERKSASEAKSKMQSLRQKKDTKEEAQKVYMKHGSRRGGRTGPETSVNQTSRKRARTEPVVVNEKSGLIDQVVPKKKQLNIPDMFRRRTRSATTNIQRTDYNEDSTPVEVCTNEALESANGGICEVGKTEVTNVGQWTCTACTFENKNLAALTCEICDTERVAS